MRTTERSTGKESSRIERGKYCLKDANIFEIAANVVYAVLCLVCIPFFKQFNDYFLHFVYPDITPYTLVIKQVEELLFDKLLNALTDKSIFASIFSYFFKFSNVKSNLFL